MATDVYFADQICYINDINKSHAVCYALINSIKILNKAFSFQYQAEIIKESKQIKEALQEGLTISDPSFPLYRPFSQQRAFESIIDNFLIGAYFEIVAKAMLLNKGYIVHKIKESKDLKIQELYKRQKIEPILMEELLSHDSFKMDKSKNKNGLTSLGFNTIDYRCLYTPNYASSINLTTDFTKIAQYYIELRNSIHFPLTGASEKIIDNTVDLSNIDFFETINQYNETEIIPTIKKIQNNYSFFKGWTW